MFGSFCHTFLHGHSGFKYVRIRVLRKNSTQRIQFTKLIARGGVSVKTPLFAKSMGIGFERAFIRAAASAALYAGSLSRFASGRTEIIMGNWSVSVEGWEAEACKRHPSQRASREEGYWESCQPQSRGSYPWKINRSASPHSTISFCNKV